MANAVSYELLMSMLGASNGIALLDANSQLTHDQMPDFPTNVYDYTFNNATFSGEAHAFEVQLSDKASLVSFWGSATQNATGTAGESFVILSPQDFTLLERFVGQVDQFALGYNPTTNDFKYMPVQITAADGMALVTAPYIAVGTQFSWQFMLVLAE
ncbi:MAG: hypothetical protein FWB76_02795 [Oscillospiraceae bacterium]|nr:hypothetical protein [Oscillospiraceae bacterium]